MSNAAIVKSELIKVTPTVREDDGSHWLKVDVSNGWDDVKKICKKVLEFEGRNYTFMSWNSDTLVSNFKENTNVAVIRRRK